MKLDDRPAVPTEKTDDGRGNHPVTDNKGDNPSGPVTKPPDADTENHTKEQNDNKTEYEDDDLGIYEDTDDGDDLTDTELELEKLRLEKRIREENERLEKEKAKAKEKESEKVPEENVFLTETKQPESSSVPVKGGETGEKSEKERVIPKAELKIESQLSLKTWPPPRHDTGQPRSGAKHKPRAKTTNMALELAESR